jgi:hypothetical protein
VTVPHEAGAEPTARSPRGARASILFGPSFATGHPSS